MDFDKPADPAAQQRAKMAEEERVKTLQEELQDITALRVRRFGQSLRAPSAGGTPLLGGQRRPLMAA